MYLKLSQLSNCDWLTTEVKWTHWKSVIATAVSFWLLSKWIKSQRQKSQLSQKISTYRRDLASIQEEIKQDLLGKSGENILVTEKRKTILQLPIHRLIVQLKNDRLRPVDVLEAYQARAIEFNEAKNCVCKFLPEAREWAINLESVPKEERGPLFGLPISVKECFFIKGHDCTVGLSRFMNCPLEEDGNMVSFLKKLGAVPFCLTNIPQTMKSFGCSNPIFGETLHPEDSKRTPGGSSGGEACLLAGGGSVLGIGTDVCGSLRTPSVFCGIIGIKPTHGRIFDKGRRSGSDGRLVGVFSEAGFMSRTVDGVALGMRSLLERVNEVHTLEPTVVPLPWNEKLFNPKRKLRIGWLYDTAFVECTPACKRAVRLATELLENAGHHVEHFHPFDTKFIFEQFIKLISADGGHLTMKWLEGDFIDPSILTFYIKSKIPNWVLTYILSPITEIFSPMVAQGLRKHVSEIKDLWMILKEIETHKQNILKEWNDKQLDAIIAPGFPIPPTLSHHPGKLYPALECMAPNNILNLPGGTVPISRVTKEDQLLDTYPEKSKYKGDISFAYVREAMKDAEGLPLAVQVYGKPWEEEMVLGVMKELERLRDEKKLFQPMEW